MSEFLNYIMDPNKPWMLLEVILDLVIVYYAIYRFLMTMRGTKALHVLVGVLLVMLLYIISGSNSLNLVMTRWILDKFMSALIIILFILFQDDIRNALSRVGSSRKIFTRGFHKVRISTFDELAKAAVKLSRKRRGALIILKRDANLDSVVQQGVKVNVNVDAEFLYLLFFAHAENPLHDGAAVIEGDKIVQVASYLPLTENPNVDISLGSRHRAAIGLTERTDAIAVVVSEETGIISLAIGGQLERNLDSIALKKRLMEEFQENAKTQDVVGEEEGTQDG